MNVDLIVPLAGMATGLVLAFPVIRAVIRYIERRAETGSKGGLAGDVRGELDEVQGRLTELADLGNRVAELEERLDFTERVLVQHKERQLPGGAE
jgi:predicted short-subunit dehydrogenase-like oxidoreductase (DUF2520 family)